MKCSFWRSQVTKCEVIFVFCVTGAILWQCVNASALFFRGRRSTCDVAFRDVVAGAAFCDVAKVLFPRIAMAVTCKRDTTANIVAGAGFGDCLEKWRKLRKSHTF